MPNYDLTCSKCDKTTETEISFGVVRDLKTGDKRKLNTCECGNDLCWSDISITPCKTTGRKNVNLNVKKDPYVKYQNKNGGPKPIMNGKIYE